MNTSLQFVIVCPQFVTVGSRSWKHAKCVRLVHVYLGTARLEPSMQLYPVPCLEPRILMDFFSLVPYNSNALDR